MFCSCSLQTKKHAVTMQVGFNAGHSSLNWLLSSHPSSKVLAFDLGDHNYVEHALDFLKVGRLLCYAIFTVATRTTEQVRCVLPADLIFVWLKPRGSDRNLLYL